MSRGQKRMIQRIGLGVSTLILVMMLAACGSSGSIASSTPTSKPATPTPSPTPSPTPTGTYIGTNFSMSYPPGVQERQVDGLVTFDLDANNSMTIEYQPNPNGALSTNELAQTFIKVFEKATFSSSEPATIAPTATVGDDSWVQISATGTLLLDPGTPGTLVLLADNHPANAANTNSYLIVYSGPTATWSQSNAVFQAMLQSFKFSS